MTSNIYSTQIIPSLSWPTQQECIEIVNQALPKLPCKIYYYGSQMTIEKQNGEYQFKYFGERGSLEHEIATNNLDDFCSKIFNFNIRFDGKG